jgi:hypothetical protein
MKPNPKITKIIEIKTKINDFTFSLIPFFFKNMNQGMAGCADINHG